jgi:hypothetical protein
MNTCAPSRIPGGQPAFTPSLATGPGTEHSLMDLMHDGAGAFGSIKNTFKAPLLFWRTPASESGNNIMLTTRQLLYWNIDRLSHACTQ